MSIMLDDPPVGGARQKTSETLHSKAIVPGVTPPDLDDPHQFVCRPAVPILDTHIRKGREVDESLLRLIAKNSNEACESGDYPLLLIGHTDDHGPEDKQPPLAGFVRKFVIGDWQGKPCILADLCFIRSKMGEAMQYPRRSAEIWYADNPEHNVIDSVCLMKRTPERRLGLVTYAKVRERYAKRFGIEQAVLVRYEVQGPAAGNCGTGHGGFKPGNKCGHKSLRNPKVEEARSAHIEGRREAAKHVKAGTILSKEGRAALSHAANKHRELMEVREKHHAEKREKRNASARERRKAAKPAAHQEEPKVEPKASPLGGQKAESTKSSPVAKSSPGPTQSPRIIKLKSKTPEQRDATARAEREIRAKEGANKARTEGGNTEKDHADRRRADSRVKAEFEINERYKNAPRREAQQDRPEHEAKAHAAHEARRQVLEGRVSQAKPDKTDAGKSPKSLANEFAEKKKAGEFARREGPDKPAKAAQERGKPVGKPVGKPSKPEKSPGLQSFPGHDTDRDEMNAKYDEGGFPRSPRVPAKPVQSKAARRDTEPRHERAARLAHKARKAGIAERNKRDFGEPPTKREKLLGERFKKLEDAAGESHPVKIGKAAGDRGPYRDDRGVSTGKGFFTGD